jgi:hypothetical protein
MKSPFAWDSYSDQPALLKDKAYKKRMRSQQVFAYVRLLLTFIIFFPITLVAMLLKREQAQNIQSVDFYGMGVELDKGEAQFTLLQELGVKHVLVRMPLWEMDRLEEYKAFIQRLHEQGLTILINVLQDREHIEDLALLKQDLTQVFQTLEPYANEFQIGNAINRTKWGFFSVDEYLGFYQVAQRLRDKSFTQLQLIGPAVIDFEYHHTLRALFNGFAVSFDRLSSLLYVDRRGAPQNKQMVFFDTQLKIKLLSAMIGLSHKVQQKKFYVTEVNWPLHNTVPYAPTSEKECVSPEDYAKYMRDYHKIALQTGMVERVYWHQLIAPGYGLVDNREQGLKQYPAFAAYRNMVLQDRV